MGYQWRFEELGNYWAVWLTGVSVTFQLSCAVIVVGTALGLVLVVGSQSGVRVLSQGGRAVVDIVRAIPALVLIGTMYFCLPAVWGAPLSAMTVAVVALSVNLAPFAAESIRAGVESVPRVQYESAAVLGLGRWQCARYIIGPQAIRRILPSLAGQWVTSVKLTSLAATVGVPDIWHATGQVVVDTSLALEARVIGALLYVVIILPCLWAVAMLEHMFRVRGLGSTGAQ